MSQLEFTPRTLPEGFQIPPAATEIINNLLGPLADRQELLDIRGSDYVPHPKLEIVHAGYDAILQARDNRRINHQEFEAHLKDFVDDIPEGPQRDYAIQLFNMGLIMSRYATGNPEDRQTANDQFKNSFCYENNIDANVPESVFNSKVTDPSLQAMVITQMMRANRVLNNTENQQLILALRWHLIPDRNYFKIRGLVGSLNHIALFKWQVTGELEESASILQAAAELAKSAGDETWFEMLENAGIVLGSLGRYGEAVLLLEQANIASRGDERIDEESRLFSRGNLEVSRFGLFMQVGKQTSEYYDENLMQEFAYLLGDLSNNCSDYESLLSSVFEIELARLEVVKLLGDEDLSREIQNKLLSLAVELMGDNSNEEYVQDELLPFHHSAIKHLAEKVYLQAIENLEK